MQGRTIMPGAAGLLLDALYGQKKAVLILDHPIKTIDGDYVKVQLGRRGQAIVSADSIVLPGEGFSEIDIDPSKFVRASSMPIPA